MHLDDNDYSFVAIVGSSETPEWGETAIGFGTFYHHLKRGATVSAAVDRMIAASGHNDFLFEFSAASRQGYADFLAEKQREQLAANAVNSLVGSQYPVTPPSTTPTSWIGEAAVAEPSQGHDGLSGLIPR
ncbi:hypothetical protein [Luteibacter sp. Lutesp34]|uniref:hypothetical protein n=1 Tax=Luteibacter sp. Lutesp34 TaxID=3243030 RepID=UPI0039B63302